MRCRILSHVAVTILLWSACSPDQTTPNAPDEGARPSALAARQGGIAPPQSSPHGKSYSEWAAEWWQWALETPVSINPVLDLTGENCAVNQSGQVWFLAGSFTGGTVTRECTVTTGTALFFPLINNGWFAFLNDPPEQRTEEFIRGQVSCIEAAEFPLIEIDGVPVENPGSYLEKSILFQVVLPEDNVFGVTEAQVPELTLSPSADEGFYLFLTPLTPGQHTIRWQSNADCGVSEDITYRLNVTPGQR
jgi:hypothetical protein